MVFHWRLSYSKSPHVSRTLLRILVVLNNAVAWMVSTRPPTSKSSSLFNSPSFTVSNRPITIELIVTFMFHSFSFQFASKGEVLILFFIFFQFFSVVSQDSKIYNFAGSLLLVDYYKVWSSGRDLVIRFYVKIPLEFVCVIHQDRCWVVHKPFVRMVKFQVLAHLQVDQLAHPVISSLILFLR